MTKEEKGQEGEKIARDIIQKVVDCYKGEINIYNNIILEIPSVFGVSSNGIITTEIDHLIITPYLIVLIETKNEAYLKCDYKDDYWLLMNGDEVSNPIKQNHMHKMALCDVLHVDPKIVFTIELLLDTCMDNDYSEYSNDYIMNKEKFEDNLMLLLSTKYKDKLLPDINKQLEIIEKKSLSLKKKHIENINTVKDIMKWIKTHEKAYIFSFLDTVKCPQCGSYLFFRKKNNPDFIRNNIRKSKQYFLGCKNYSVTGCEKKVNYSDKKGSGFKTVSKTSIEERIGWRELDKTNMNILESYKFLLKENEELKSQIEMIKSDLKYNEEMIKRVTLENKNLIKENDEIKRKNEELQSKQFQFKHLFWKLYIKD